MLRVLGISSALALPNSLYGSLFRGLQRMEIPNIISVMTTGLQQFGTVLILAFGGNVFHVTYWFAGCYVLNLLIYIGASGRFFSARALIPGFSTELLRRNLGFASRMMSISVMATVHRHTDKLIISKLLPIGTVGYYGVGYINVSKGQLVTGAVSQAAYPSFSALFKTGDQAGLMSQYRKLQDLLCFGIVPIFAAIAFAVLPLFSYLINEEAARMLLLPVVFLCVGFYMNGTLNVPYVVSLAVGKPGITARLNFYALFAVLPVTAILTYFLGLIGGGLSWVFYHIFGYFYSVPRICRECLGTRAWEWYRHVFRIFILIALTYGIAWVVLSVIYEYSILQLFTAYAAASICYATGAYLLIGNELRGVLTRRLRPLFNVIRGYHVRKESPREP